jgi:conjugal transfer pilus assembly protein TraV
MSDYLSAVEMASLRRALAKRTGGCVGVGRVPITVVQGIALWNAAASFESRAEGTDSNVLRLPRRRARRAEAVGDSAGLHRVLIAGMGVAAVASLAGCTTMFGGNVKGSFSCQAPGGTCAPTSKIDDAALAMISGETSLSPAGPYISPPSTNSRSTITASAEPLRSGEKVLRIVFPAHIDGAGRFREATAIHAVVERGDWMTAANEVRSPTRVSMRQTAPSTAALTEQTMAEALPMMPTLGELAAAAPELQFPSSVADIDAQNAAIVQETPAAVVAPAAGKRERPRAKHVSAVTAPAAVAMVASSAASISSGNAVSARMPTPVAVLDPVAAIRAQVAARLSAAPPRSATAPKASKSGTQAPAMGVSPVRFSLSPGTQASGATSQSLAVPGAGGKPSAGNIPPVSATPVNGPTLFPVSEVHP